MTPSSDFSCTLRWHQAGGQLRFGDPLDPVAAIALDGPAIARRFFRHDPPRPAELEQAIDVIEEALMTIAPRIGQPARFVTDDAVLRRLPAGRAAAQAAGEERSLDAAEVEALCTLARERFLAWMGGAR